MTLEPKIDIETAKADVNRWLDLKKIPNAQRSKNQKSFDHLVMAVMHDGISIDKDGVITHKLNYPIENKEGVSVCDSFKYKVRLTADEIQACIEAGGDNKIYGAALTSNNAVPSDYFGKIDTTDLNILTSIVVFFTW